MQLSVPISGYQYRNVTDNSAQLAVRSGRGMIHTISVNTGSPASTISVYDNTVASGTSIGVFSGVNPITFVLDANFSTGLTFVSGGGTPNYTVTYI